MQKNKELKRIELWLFFWGLVVLLFSCSVFFFIRNRGGLYGGFDGIQHLTAVQGQIKSFLSFSGVSNFATMGRNVGDARPMIVYQGFYWVAGFVGALLRVDAFEAIVICLSFFPLLCFGITYFSFGFILSKSVRAFLAFSYSTCPMMVGLFYQGASWPQALAVVLLPLVFWGAFRFIDSMNPFPLAIGMAFVTAAHPLTAILALGFCLPFVLIAGWSKIEFSFRFATNIFFALILFLGANAYLVFKNLGPGYGWSDGISTAKMSIRENVEFLMTVFGDADNQSRFSQIFNSSNILAGSSFGFIGLSAILFCATFLLKRLLVGISSKKNKSLEKVEPLEYSVQTNRIFLVLLAIAIIYTCLVWPSRWFNVESRVLVGQYLPIVTNLFPNRILPISIFLWLTLAGVILDKICKSKTKFEKLSVYLMLFFGIVASAQSFHALFVTPNPDISFRSNWEAHRLSSFYFGSERRFFEEFVRQEELEPRPNSAHVYLQPDRMWRWISGSQYHNVGEEKWEKASWKKQPLVQFIDGKGKAEGKRIVNNSFSESAKFVFSMPYLLKGTYQLKIKFQILNVASASFPGKNSIPLQVQIAEAPKGNPGFFVKNDSPDWPSQEAWILPDKENWDAFPLNMERLLSVPFVVEEDAPTARNQIVLDIFSGFKTQVLELSVTSLEPLPFEIIGDEPLSIRIPRNLLERDITIAIPKLYIPTYIARIRNAQTGKLLYEQGLNASEFGTPKVAISKSLLLPQGVKEASDLLIEISYSPPNFFLRWRLYIFVFCIAALCSLSFFRGVGRGKKTLKFS